ncbi:MAG: histidine phosphatase family protein [Bacteroidota bacterium]
MKTLYLLRHAKSSWDDPDLDDFDRPLNERGEKDAPKMGKRLKEREIVLDIFYSSPAARAIATAKTVARIIGFPVANIQSERKLYHADDETLMDVLRGASDKSDSIMIAGHNPGLTDFTNLLQSEIIDNIPTTGVVGIKFKITSWKDVKAKSGKLVFFDFPRR